MQANTTKEIRLGCTTNNLPFTNSPYDQNNPNFGTQKAAPSNINDQIAPQRTMPSSRGSTLGGAEEEEQENFEFDAQEVNLTVAQMHSNPVTQTMAKSGTKKRR